MNARRLILSVFATVVGSLVFTCAPTLAAEAPEAPGPVTVEAITPSSATFYGELNPSREGAAGTYELDEYQFLYRESSTECKGGNKAPASPGMSLGGGQETVTEGVSGLKAGTEYAVCLVTRNPITEEEVEGPPVTFATFTAHGEPLIAGESVSNVLSTSATLEAQINPLGEDTHYYFQYGTSSCATSPSSCTDVPALPGTDIGSAESRQTASFDLTGLAPETTYHYRVIAVNARGASEGADQTFITPTAAGQIPGSTQSGACPNEQLRAEQPYGLALPDCRAYEMVSPVEKNGNDATEPRYDLSRASVSGEAIVFTSPAGASFADPAGAQLYNQSLSRRTSGGWSTQGITPPYNAYNTDPGTSPYESLAFTPELSMGVAATFASLTSEAPAGFKELYLANFATGSYQWVSKASPPPQPPGHSAFDPYESAQDAFPLFVPMGTSTDLSHVGFFVDEVGLYEWIDGEVIRVSMANNGEPMLAAAGSRPQQPYFTSAMAGDIQNAVSSDGSQVFFTSFQKNQLYVREHTERPQSPLASPESHGTGTLTAGSDTVTEVAPLEAANGYATKITSGSAEVTLTRAPSSFFPGQSVSGPGIPLGTTITKVSGLTLTLSAPATGSFGEVFISAEYPLSFAVGQRISGNGIPRGTTITAVAPGALTLSAPVAFSGSAVVLEAGGECTVPADACTVEISASQRGVPDPNGPQEAHYTGASADGSKVFFTSRAELTEDAYTGPKDNATNLYEYDLQSGKLTDLTVDSSDADGAAVQGVVQISEDGSYVYFVAQGDLVGEAKAGAPNLYVSHDGGAPVFIAGLAEGDKAEDWAEAPGFGSPKRWASDGTVVSGDGTRLAFVSEANLTGYDNEPAEGTPTGGTTEKHPEACGGRCKEVYLYDASTGSLVCVSCNPSEARPTGPSSLGESNGALDSEHRRRNFSEDGSRLFFESYDALVPHDSNGQKNVYEYEDGHVYPISDVAGDYNSYFLDASSSGNDVFIATADQLVAQDQDNRIDVYDARVGGGFTAPMSIPPCDNGDSCKSPPTPQPGVFGVPASATFVGAGNPASTTAAKPVEKSKAKRKGCKKDFVKRHDKCIAKAKPRVKAKKPKHGKGTR